MKEGRPSFTAALVAAFRTMGERLPPDQQLARDPYGIEFAPPLLGLIFRRAPAPTAYVLYMQVRTRAIDDVLLEFVRGGGKQVVILGAGYDCRAVRFREKLRDAVVYEVDHPATQQRKRAVLGDSPARYVSFNFEQQELNTLRATLARVGHDAAAPTLTIWEGVTMYLSEEAIESSVAAIASYGGPGSALVFSYFDRRRLIEQPPLRQRVVRSFVRGIGEPFRFGWDPRETGAWFAPRGFVLRWDRSEIELARSLLPERAALRVEDRGRRIAVVDQTSAKDRS